MQNFKLCQLLVLFLPFYTSAASLTETLPDKTVTPGYLCTENDSNFDKLDYPEQVARCIRNVGTEEKVKIAAEYGVAKQDWHNYEFDHLIPLCAGGSNDIKNLWPQPLNQAKNKDKIENEVCNGMRRGTLTQAEAVQQVWVWFDSVMQQEIP